MKLSEFLKKVNCQETDLSKFSTEEKAIAAVKQNGFSLKFVKNQIPEICITAVKQNGGALQYVKKQTPEICMVAVEQNGEVLKCVKEQTPEICMTAIKQNGYALQYVKKQTPEICLATVKQNGYALQYVENQTPEICLAAVKQYGDALKYVKEQTPEICITAVKQNRNAIQYVDKNIFESQFDITTELDIPTFGLTNTTLYINSRNRIIVDKPHRIEYTTLLKRSIVEKTANDWEHKEIIIPNEFVDKLPNKTGTIIEDLFMIIESPSDNEDYAIINEEEKVAMMPYKMANKGDMVFWDYSLKNWIHDHEELYTSIPSKHILPDRKLGVVKEDLFVINNQNSKILSQINIKQLTQIIVSKEECVNCVNNVWKTTESEIIIPDEFVEVTA